MAKRSVEFSAFQGFSEGSISFLTELEKNNTRDWFNANKKRYQEELKAPFDAFVEDAEGTYGSGKTFRIYQDQRFHKDRPPYKTHGSAVFEKRGVVHYVHLEKDHLFVASGCHEMRKDQLQRFRDAIMDGRKGAKLQKLVDEAASAGLELGGEALKTAPRGFPKDHARIQLLRHKGLTTARRLPIAKWMFTKKAGPRVVEIWREGAAINEWLEKHGGTSEEGRRFVKKT